MYFYKCLVCGKKWEYNDINDIRINSIIRHYTTSHKISKYDVYSLFCKYECNINFKVELCGWCKNKVATAKYNINIINNNEIIIKLTYPNGYFCRSQECNDKRKIIKDKFSVKYIMKQYKCNSEQECICIKNKLCKKKGRTLQNYINRFGKILGTEKYNDYINKHKYSISLEGYIKKYGKEEGTKKYNINRIEKEKITLPKMIERYGKKEGTLKYENWKEKINTKKRYINKYGEKKGTELYKIKMHNFIMANSLGGMIKKYGKEKGKIKYKQLCDRMSYVNSEKFYIDKYGEKIGKIEYIEANKRKALTLHNYINKYGKEKGEIKYNEYLVKREKSYLLNNSGKSIIQIEFFNLLKNSIKENVTVEKPIIINDNITFFVDFYIEKYKIGIEFYGDYWHCNPKKYNADELINFPNKIIKTSKQIWDKDNRRLKSILSKKYINNFIIIYESFFRQDKKNSIDSVNNTINRIINNNLYKKIFTLNI